MKSKLIKPVGLIFGGPVFRSPSNYLLLKMSLLLSVQQTAARSKHSQVFVKIALLHTKTILDGLHFLVKLYKSCCKVKKNERDLYTNNQISQNKGQDKVQRTQSNTRYEAFQHHLDVLLVSECAFKTYLCLAQHCTFCYIFSFSSSQTKNKLLNKKQLMKN